MSRQIGRNEFVVRDPESGELQIIDMNTGEVISSQSNLIPEKTFAFSYEMAMLICQKVAEGATLAQLDKDPDVPPLHIIQHWKRSQPMFAAEMSLARKQRAEVYHDKVAEIADNAAKLNYGTKEELAGAKLAADQLKWLAEKGNPDAYGNKITHEGSEEKPITMRVINTGINRALPDVVINQTKEVQNVEETNTSRDVRDADGTEQAVSGEVSTTRASSEEHSAAGEDHRSSQESSEEGDEVHQD
jgi:hypothetical protein